MGLCSHVCGGGGGCDGGSVPLGAVPVLSWCGEVSLEGKQSSSRRVNTHTNRHRHTHTHTQSHTRHRTGCPARTSLAWSHALRWPAKTEGQHTDKQTDRHTHTHTTAKKQRRVNTHTDRQTDRHTTAKAQRMVNTHTGRQTDRQTDRQTHITAKAQRRLNTHINRQTDTDTITHTTQSRMSGAYFSSLVARATIACEEIEQPTC